MQMHQELELATEHNLESQIMLDSQISQPPKKKSPSEPSKSPSISLDSIKSSINGFYNSKSAGPIQSYLSWMETNKPLTDQNLQKTFYHNVKHFYFSITESLEVRDQKSEIFCLLNSRDNTTVFTGCVDHNIYLWDTKSHSMRPEILTGHHSTVVCLAMSIDGNTLLSGSYDKSIFLWDFHRLTKICELREHTEGVVALAVSYDGELFVSGSDDKTIVIWRLENREKLKTLEGHSSAITCVVFTLDDKRLISSSWDSSIRIWNVETGQQECVLGEHQDMIRALVLSPDSRILASGGGDRVIKIWDLNERREVGSLEGHVDMVRALAMTSDGSKLVSGGRDKTIMVWDLKNMVLLRKMKGHRAIVRDLLISRDNTLILSGSGDMTLRIWNLDSIDDTCLKGKYEAVSAITMNPQGNRIFSAHNSTIVVWDLNTAKTIGKLTKHEYRVLALAVTKNGERLFSAGQEPIIFIWEVATLSIVKTLYGHNNPINSLKVTHDGLGLLSAGSDNFIIKWDLQTYDHYRISGQGLGASYCLEISKDNKNMLIGTLEGWVTLWDFYDSKAVKRFQAHEKAVTSVKISPGNQKIITASLDSKIKIWKTSNGTMLYCLDAHEGPVLSAELNEEGTKLISGSDDGSIRLWDVRLGLQIGIIKIPKDSFTTLILSPDGVRIIAGLNEMLKLWEVNQLHILKTLENFSEINAILLTRDEKTIVTGGNDKLLRTWDINTMQEKGKLEGHSKPILTIKAFNESDNVASGSADNTIRIWDVAKRVQVRILKGSPSQISSLAIFSNDQYILSGVYDKTVRLWDLNNYTQCHVFRFHTGAIKAVSLTPDNKVYVSGGKDRMISIVNLDDKELIKQFKAHEDTINCLVIVNEGNQIISGARDKTMKVWDLWTGRLVKILKSHRAPVTTMITNKNWTKMLSGAEDGTIHIWDLRNFKKCTNYDGHEKSVNGLAMINDETRLISVGSDHAIRVWRLEAVDLLPFLEGHFGPVTQVFLMRNEDRLLSISTDNSMILWDIQENKPFRKYMNKVGQIRCMAMLNDCEHVLLVTTEEIKIWNIKNWSQKSVIPAKDIPETVIITPDDHRCFIGCEDTYIRVWDLEEKEIIATLDGHIGPVTSLVILRRKQWVVSGSSDNTIVIWDLERLSLISVIKEHQHYVSCLLVDFDENFLISGSYDRSVMIWNIENLNQTPKTIQNLPYEVQSLVLTEGGKRLIVGCAKNQNSKGAVYNKNEDFLHVYDLKTLQKVTSLNNSINCSSLAVFQSGDTLISGSKDHSISFWNLRKLEHEKTLSGFSRNVLAELMTQDCEKLILACDDKNIVVWNLKFTTLNTILSGHTGNPISLTAKQDGSKLVSGATDKSIRVWDLETKKIVGVLQGHSAAVTSVAFSKNESILISGSDDCVIRLWDFVVMKIITVVSCPTSVNSILDLENAENFITGDKGKSLKLWGKLKNGELGYELVKQINFEAGIAKFIASPNLKVVLVMLENFKIQTWKIKKWRLLTEIDGKKGNTRTVPIFLLEKNSRLIIYFDRIIDCYSGDTIFTFQINYGMQSFFYDTRNSFYYFLSTDFRLRKIEKSWLQAYFFNYMNYSSLANLPQEVDIICRQNLCTFPFSLSFLHLISIFDKSEFFTDMDLEAIYGKTEVCLSNFYHEDIFRNTPLDVLVLKKNATIIFKFFELLFKQFEGDSCPFYEKVRFLNYQFSKKKNMLDLLNHLLPLIGDDLRIVSRLFENSFMEFDPIIYNNDILFEELAEPIFIEADEIYTINKDLILQKLKKKLQTEEKSIYEKASRVKAKIIAIPDLTDITNKKLSKVLEHIANLESDNEFFANDIFEMVVNQLWRTQIWRYYLSEFCIFFFCFLMYNVNHIFLMPAIASNQTWEESRDLDVYMIFFDVFLMFYSLFYLANEIKQMITSGFFTYFKNIWNYFDIALIPLLFTSSVLNIIIVTSDVDEMDICKLINALCMFCFWFRFLSFFRAIKETSSMMRLIFNVIRSVKYFVLFMAFFMMTLAFTFFLLHKASDEEESETTIFQAIYAFYESTVGDSSGITDFVIVYPILNYIFMIASTFLFAIILLNLLVAIIGDKHNEINDAEEKTRLYELTNIVVDTNSNLVTKLIRWIRKPKERGNYLIYLYNENQEKQGEKGIDEKMEGYLKMFSKENERLIDGKMKEMEKVLISKIKN